MTSLELGDVGYSWGVLGSATIAAAPTGIVRSANAISVITSTAHKFMPGQPVVIQTGVGALGTNFNGTYIITICNSTTTFTAVPSDSNLQNLPNDTGGAGTATSLQGEQPTAGQLTGQGKAFALVPYAGQIGTGVKGGGKFDAAPGSFEVDVEGADVDADGNYQQIASGNITAVDAVKQTFDFEAPLCNNRFIRMTIKTRTNAVNFIGWIKR